MCVEANSMHLYRITIMSWQKQQQQQLLQPNGDISLPLPPFSVHCCCYFVVVFVKESKGYVSFIQWTIHFYLSIRWFRCLISCFVLFFLFCISFSYMWCFVKNNTIFFLSFFPSFFHSVFFFLPFLISFIFPSNINNCYYHHHLTVIVIIIIIISSSSSSSSNSSRSYHYRYSYCQSHQLTWVR